MDRSELMADPEIRRTFEEEFLFGEATETIAALLQDLNINQAELAERLGVTRGRVSQILSGGENLTLRTLGAVGWALGIRLALNPHPMTQRAGTPAVDDLLPPAWLTRLGRVNRISMGSAANEAWKQQRAPIAHRHLRVIGEQVDREAGQAA